MKVDFSGQRSSGCPSLATAQVLPLIPRVHMFNYCYLSLRVSGHHFSTPVVLPPFLFHQFSTLIIIFWSLLSWRTSSPKCQSSVSHSDHQLNLSTLSLTLFYYLYLSISLKLPVIWPCCIFSHFSLCFLPSSLDLMNLHVNPSLIPTALDHVSDRISTPDLSNFSFFCSYSQSFFAPTTKIQNIFEKIITESCVPWPQYAAMQS